MLVKPGERESLSQQLYKQLRSALMDGVLAPGERLTIASVSQQFGTSITPVREAIFRLVSERALEMRAATSISVPRIDTKQLREIQVIRVNLEGAAVERAAPIITDTQLAHLEAIQHAFIAAARNNPQEASVLNRDFHFALLHIAGMPILEGIVENMWVLMGPFLRVFHDQTPARFLSAEEHKHNDVLAALRDRNPDAARLAITEDILSGLELIRQMEEGTASTVSLTAPKQNVRSLEGLGSLSPPRT
jgi:DNA-binding GntR family transcriptional regulator